MSQNRVWPLPFIWNFADATWDHLQDIKAALSPHLLLILYVLVLCVVCVIQACDGTWYLHLIH